MPNILLSMNIYIFKDDEKGKVILNKDGKVVLKNGRNN